MRTERTNILVDKELKERIEANYPGLTWNERLTLLLDKEGPAKKESSANKPEPANYITRQEHERLKEKFNEVLNDLIQANNLKRPSSDEPSK